MTRIHSLSDVLPGDIALGPIHGFVGFGVGLGQIALGEGFSVGQLKIRHARIVVQASECDTTDPDHPYGLITKPVGVEAMPSGARYIGMTNDNAWTPDWAYFRLAEDYLGQAQDAAAVAEAMVGTPYSFASYAALAAWRWGVRTPRLERWIDRRGRPRTIAWPSGGGPQIQLPCEAICSVLVDQAWSLTGKRIMEGVPHQVVTPGALAGRLLEMVEDGTAALTRPRPLLL